MTPEEADKLRFWLKEVVYAPQYAGRIISAVPALLTSLEACQSKDQELAEEFRRLAANSEETQRCFKSPPMNRSAMQWERGVREGEAIAFRRAAQILEEKLNG